MRRVRVVARSTVVELLRRRAVVALLFLVPLAFYLVRHHLVGQSIRQATVGMAWALSTWTVDGTDGGYVRRALLHAAAVVVLLTAGTVLARARALRRRPHLRLL
ncbi:hypothetical protein ACI797_14940 [Geodermatophilus sp. SYSU D00691]